MDKDEIKKLIQEEVEKQLMVRLEKLFGRTIKQIREFFLKNIN